MTCLRSDTPFNHSAWGFRHSITLIEGRAAPGTNSEVLLEFPVALLVPQMHPAASADQILEAFAAGQSAGGRPGVAELRNPAGEARGDLARKTTPVMELLLQGLRTRAAATKKLA